MTKEEKAAWQRTVSMMEFIELDEQSDIETRTADLATLAKALKRLGKLDRLAEQHQKRIKEGPLFSRGTGP